MEPQKGAIAFCSQGHKGLITSEAPKMVTFEDGSKGLAWTGVHIGPEHVGRPWVSRKPMVVSPTGPKTYMMLLAIVERAKRLKGIQ